MYEDKNRIISRKFSTFRGFLISGSEIRLTGDFEAGSAGRSGASQSGLMSGENREIAAFVVGIDRYFVENLPLEADAGDGGKMTPV